MTMANQQQPNKSAAGTNVQKVRQQNAQSAAGGQFGTEFASETNAQQVRQQNQQAEANKQQNSNQ
jgi:small acid-soluble spore protein E (minor gamma-type SASP)